MTPKYYTPKAEEFFVGFEYERKDEDENWVRSVFPDRYVTGYDKWKITSLVEVVYEYLTDGENFRVKYLDREDIESLGFDKTFKNEFGIEYMFYENKDYQYCLYQSLNGVLIFRADKNASWLVRPSFSDAYRPIFSGTIKNKSELKRLMVQLGITQE